MWIHYFDGLNHHQLATSDEQIAATIPYARLHQQNIYYYINGGADPIGHVNSIDQRAVPWLAFIVNRKEEAADYSTNRSTNEVQLMASVKPSSPTARQLDQLRKIQGFGRRSKRRQIDCGVAESLPRRPRSRRNRSNEAVSEKAILGNHPRHPRAEAKFRPHTNLLFVGIEAGSPPVRLRTTEGFQPDRSDHATQMSPERRGLLKPACGCTPVRPS